MAYQFDDNFAESYTVEALHFALEFSDKLKNSSAKWNKLSGLSLSISSSEKKLILFEIQLIAIFDVIVAMRIFSWLCHLSNLNPMAYTSKRPTPTSVQQAYTDFIVPHAYMHFSFFFLCVCVYAYRTCDMNSYTRIHRCTRWGHLFCTRTPENKILKYICAWCGTIGMGVRLSHSNYLYWRCRPGVSQKINQQQTKKKHYPTLCFFYVWYNFHLWWISQLSLAAKICQNFKPNPRSLCRVSGVL